MYRKNMDRLRFVKESTSSTTPERVSLVFELLAPNLKIQLSLIHPLSGPLYHRGERAAIELRMAL